jgi:catechol 2,3-dioxygenase-like lactoylglutathione lyase family enzyme
MHQPCFLIPTVMTLDHVTLVAPDCAPLRRFFVDIAGMQRGARPPFGVGGHWLYLDGRPVLHLIEAGAASAYESRSSTRIDHFALRVADAREWRALIARLDAASTPYHLADVPLTGEFQLFVQPAPGVTVEFVTARS